MSILPPPDGNGNTSSTTTELRQPPVAADVSADDLAALKGFIENLVRKRDYVSFAEIRKCGDDAGLDLTGEWTLSFGDYGIAIWADMSKLFYLAIRELLEEKTLFLAPCSLSNYVADGILLNLPLAKRPPKGGYRHLHWTPTLLRVVPFE